MTTPTHTFTVKGQDFIVPTKYTFIRGIGCGAYGTVCSAKNEETGQNVAIKKICKVFDHLNNAKRVLREMRLLRHLTHENIIQIIDILPPHDPSNWEDIYIVFELMDTDLHKIVKSPQPLTDDHVQYFLYQLLRGMKFVHSAHCLHRDLKPGNLLLNANCDLKVCDFGLARTADPETDQKGFMTGYVATRWYRAPEIMLSWKEYTRSVDVWSVGCVFGEMLARRPLFPGRDHMDQLKLIVDLLGSPTDEELQHVANEKALAFIKGLKYRPKVDWRSIFPTSNPVALDLLEKMLQFDPKKRITIEEALEHEYLAFLHDPQDEPFYAPHGRSNVQVGADGVINFDFDQGTITKEQLRKLIFEEILTYHPEVETMRPYFQA